MNWPRGAVTGSQTPRVANYPPYAVTAAPEVIEFASRCFGLHLDPWQEFVLTHGLGQTSAGDWTAKKAALWVPRQNGKGGVIEALELAWLFLFREDRLIVHSAHQHRTSRQAYQRLEALIRGSEFHAEVEQYRQTNGEQEIKLHDGRQLQYTTRSRTAVRGFSAPKLILDEGQELTAEQMAAMLPTVSAMPNWQVWFFGTPPSDARAWAYNLKADGEAGTERLAWFDWGLETVDLADVAVRRRLHEPRTWYRHNPAMGIRIDRETVEDEAKPSGLGELFAQERLGMWQPRAATGADAIPYALWTELAMEAERPTDVAFAVVVSHDRSHTAIAAVGPRHDGLLQVSLVDYRRGTEWVAERVADLRDEYKPVAIALQDKGPSATLVPEFEALGLAAPEERDAPRRGDLAMPWSHDVATAFGLLVDHARQRRLCHVDDAPLNTAVGGTPTRPLGGGTTWDYRASAEAAALQAATLALWAYLTRVDAVTSAYDPLDNLW